VGKVKGAHKIFGTAPIFCNAEWLEEWKSLNKKPETILKAILSSGLEEKEQS